MWDVLETIKSSIVWDFRRALYRASDVSQKKKQNFAGSSGANSPRNQLISGDFCSEKVKIRGKIS